MKVVTLRSLPRVLCLVGSMVLLIVACSSVESTCVGLFVASNSGSELDSSSVISTRRLVVGSHYGQSGSMGSQLGLCIHTTKICSCAVVTQGFSQAAPFRQSRTAIEIVP